MAVNANIILDLVLTFHFQLGLVLVFPLDNYNIKTSIEIENQLIAEVANTSDNTEMIM